MRREIPPQIATLIPNDVHKFKLEILILTIRSADEYVLGTPLIERGREARLTGFGEEVAARARDILGAVDELADIARAAEDRLVGRLRLGVIPTIAPYLLPRVLAGLARDHGGLDVHVRVPSAEALRAMRLLLLEEGHCFRDQALAFCAIQSALSRDGLDGSSLSTLVQMVGAGLGVTLIPEMAVPVETRSAPVAVAQFPDPAPSRTIGMIWRKSTPLAPQLDELAALVRRAAGYG